MSWRGQGQQLPDTSGDVGGFGQGPPTLASWQFQDMPLLSVPVFCKAAL